VCVVVVVVAVGEVGVGDGVRTVFADVFSGCMRHGALAPNNVSGANLLVNVHLVRGFLPRPQHLLPTIAVEPDWHAARAVPLHSRPRICFGLATTRTASSGLGEVVHLN